MRSLSQESTGYVEIEGKYRICGKEEENKVHIREL